MIPGFHGHLPAERRIHYPALVMRRLLLSLFLVLIQAGAAVALQGPSRGITTISPDGREFVNVFNAASDRTRLVTVFSPTCGHCLRGAADIQNILSKEPTARIKVLILWAPILGRDSRRAALQAAAYLRDPRAEHFWDLWNFGRQHYNKKLQYPDDKSAWNIYILYKPHLAWHRSGPEPTVWMQGHHLDFGLEYTADLLHEHVKKLVR